MRAWKLCIKMSRCFLVKQHKRHTLFTGIEQWSRTQISVLRQFLSAESRRLFLLTNAMSTQQFAAASPRRRDAWRDFRCVDFYFRSTDVTQCRTRRDLIDFRAGAGSDQPWLRTMSIAWSSGQQLTILYTVADGVDTSWWFLLCTTLWYLAHSL